MTKQHKATRAFREVVEAFSTTLSMFRQQHPRTRPVEQREVDRQTKVRKVVVDLQLLRLKELLAEV